MLDAKLFDHTLLKADATDAEVIRLCAEAREYGFMSVCVNGCYTALAKERLGGCAVRVCTVIGFPLGQMSTAAKCEEARLALADGADEIDMMINIGALKSGREAMVREEISRVKAVCGRAVLKVIIETCLLSDDEKRQACGLAVAAGADFVKTSTGFSHQGATVADVALMRTAVGGQAGVKAAGGISDRETAEALIRAGADRLGCSKTVEIGDWLWH